MATVAVFALIMAVRSSRAGALVLSAPFDRPVVFIAVATAVAALSALGLALAMKGITNYFVLTGLFAIPLLVAAGFLGPRIGVGLFIGSVVAGQLAGSVFLDHIGAYGVPVYRVDLLRVAGVVSLLLGVALIRGFRS
jgi:transporter family-2 protein